MPLDDLEDHLKVEVEGHWREVIKADLPKPRDKPFAVRVSWHRQERAGDFVKEQDHLYLSFQIVGTKLILLLPKEITENELDERITALEVATRIKGG